MPDDALRVRLATEADLPALHRLIPRSVRALSRGYYTMRRSTRSAVFGGCAADCGPQLCRDRRRAVVACGGVTGGAPVRGDQMKGEADPLVDPARERARLRAFFVDPDWARRGIGSRLLDACVGAARAAGFRRLELAATLPGEPLYRAYGFEPLERIEAPLGDGLGLPIVRMGRAVEVE